MYFHRLSLLLASLCLSSLLVQSSPVSLDGRAVKPPAKTPSKPTPKPPTTNNPPTSKPPTSKPPTSKPPTTNTPTKPGSAKACTPKSKPKTTKKRSWMDNVSLNFFSKRAPIIIGYHGTNGANAAEYLKQTKENRGLGSPSQFNGADGELGAGLYISDDTTVAKTFASGSVKFAQGRGDKRPKATEEWICTLEMQDSNWINMISKAWIPYAYIARPKKVGGKSVNDPEVLKLQESIITSQGLQVEKTVRFSPLSDKANADGQAMIPPSALIHVTARSCVPVAQFTPGTLGKYTSLRAAWKIQVAEGCD